MMIVIIIIIDIIVMIIVTRRSSDLWSLARGRNLVRGGGERSRRGMPTTISSSRDLGVQISVRGLAVSRLVKFCISSYPFQSYPGPRHRIDPCRVSW